MDLRSLPLFQMMTRRLSWLGARQQVLAQNIANSDTPGYKPRDLKPLDFRSLAAGHMGPLAPAMTDTAHLASFFPAAPSRAEKDKHPIETTLSGNAVTLEEQLMKANQTATDFELTTSLYRKHLQMIKDALGRSGL